MEITLTQWVVCLCWLVMGWIGVATVVSCIRRRWHEREGRLHRMTCRLCLHVYEVGHRRGVGECPRCGAKNERGGRIGRE